MPSVPQTIIAAAFHRLKGDGAGFALLGVYHVEPQCSAYPFGFPFGDTPDHWRLGEHFSLTEDSVFWFNFFPEQPYLFEKTFAVWALFQMLPTRASMTTAKYQDANCRRSALRA